MLSPARRSRRRRLLSLLGALLILGGLLPIAAAAPVLAVLSPDIVISEVYGGGGNTGATYTHDYIELYNRGASAGLLGRKLGPVHERHRDGSSSAPTTLCAPSCLT